MIRFDLSKDTAFCFDLDDTLYKEIDFLRSGYRVISSLFGDLDGSLCQKMIEWRKYEMDVFGKLLTMHPLAGLRKEELVKIYRQHRPDIALEPGVKEFMDKIKQKKAKTALITDGRSITQRNKLSALGLDGFFDCEIISEEIGTQKPDIKNFLAVVCELKCKEFVYFGDNPAKDFIAPNQLGWLTVALENDGRNIHGGSHDMFPKDHRAKCSIKSFSEIEIY